MTATQLVDTQGLQGALFERALHCRCTDVAQIVRRLMLQVPARHASTAGKALGDQLLSQWAISHRRA